jgi:hypothetical protein
LACGECKHSNAMHTLLLPMTGSRWLMSLYSPKGSTFGSRPPFFTS